MKYQKVSMLEDILPCLEEYFADTIGDERKAINYKYVYRVSAPGHRPVIVKRQRITYTIKYLQAHGGQAVVNGQTFELM